MPSLSALVPDPQSRTIVRDFCVQSAIGLGLMCALFVVRGQTLAELGQAAVRVFTFYAAIDCVRASVARAPLTGRSLSRWDQAAAHSFCATFFDLLLNWPS